MIWDVSGPIQFYSDLIKNLFRSMEWIDFCVILESAKQKRDKKLFGESVESYSMIHEKKRDRE